MQCAVLSIVCLRKRGLLGRLNRSLLPTVLQKNRRNRIWCVFLWTIWSCSKAATKVIVFIKEIFIFKNFFILGFAKLRTGFYTLFFFKSPAFRLGLHVRGIWYELLPHSIHYGSDVHLVFTFYLVLACTCTGFRFFLRSSVDIGCKDR